MELADIFRYILLLIIGVLLLNAYIDGRVTLKSLLISFVICAIVYFVIARPDKY